jgi:hypothetical protein
LIEENFSSSSCQVIFPKIFALFIRSCIYFQFCDEKIVSDWGKLRSHCKEKRTRISSDPLIDTHLLA